MRHSTVSADVVAETKVPCWVPDWSYFRRVDVAVMGPIAVAALFQGVGVVLAVGTKKRRERLTAAMDRGMWNAAPFTLYVLDLIYPIVSRTLFQFFTCRPLGESGGWLEVDYVRR